MLRSDQIDSGLVTRREKEVRMRRRPFDLRRPSRRRWSSFPHSLWAWIIVVGFVFLMLIILLSRDHRQPRSDPSLNQVLLLPTPTLFYETFSHLLSLNMLRIVINFPLRRIIRIGMWLQVCIIFASNYFRLSELGIELGQVA